MAARKVFYNTSKKGERWFREIGQSEEESCPKTRLHLKKAQKVSVFSQ